MYSPLLCTTPAYESSEAATATIIRLLSAIGIAASHARLIGIEPGLQYQLQLQQSCLQPEESYPPFEFQKI
jgi:hypothetical protein